MLGFVSMTKLVLVMIVPFLGRHGIPHLGIGTLIIIVFAIELVISLLSVVSVL